MCMFHLLQRMFWDVFSTVSFFTFPGNILGFPSRQPTMAGQPCGSSAMVSSDPGQQTACFEFFGHFSSKFFKTSRVKFHFCIIKVDLVWAKKGIKIGHTRFFRRGFSDRWDIMLPTGLRTWFVRGLLGLKCAVYHLCAPPKNLLDAMCEVAALVYAVCGMLLSFPISHKGS